MNILKFPFQYSIFTAKETPFRLEIMRYNDLEQTNTLFLRENRNQNASNFANAICIHDTWMLWNQYIDFCYSEQFIANFIPCFLQFSFGLLCMALLVLKDVWSGSVNNLNLRHMVRSNELQVNNESFQSSVRSACSGLNFSNRTESKQCENKLSAQNNEIPVHNN